MNNKRDKFVKNIAAGHYGRVLFQLKPAYNGKNFERIYDYVFINKRVVFNAVCEQNEVEFLKIHKNRI